MLTNLRTRAADTVIALLVGNSVRSVLLGALVLWLVGQCLGWWWAAAIIGGAVVDTIWRASRVPSRWRMW